MAATTKECPECYSEIDARAKTCPNCQTKIVTNRGAYLINVLLGAGGLLFLSVGVFGGSALFAILGAILLLVAYAFRQ